MTISDPKILIDPLSWTDDTVTIAVIGVMGAAILFIAAAIFCWYTKSKHRYFTFLILFYEYLTENKI